MQRPVNIYQIYIKHVTFIFININPQNISLYSCDHHTYIYTMNASLGPMKLQSTILSGATAIK